MDAVNRKVTYRLYPTPRQEAVMRDVLGLHQRLYNAALQQRIWAWQRKKRIGFNEQCKELTALRADDPEYAALNAQSCQVTLKRLERAFQAFFRRVKSEETPGFPRFKSYHRFSGWGYKTHGDGWKYLPDPSGKHGRLRLSGIGSVRMRGKPRTLGVPKTCEILHNGGKWYASVTLACTPARQSGRDAIGLDWGLESFVTVAVSSGVTESLPNPRHLKHALKSLKQAQRSLSRKRRGSRNQLKARKIVASLHQKVANRRSDFLHQVSARLVGRSGLIATEALNVRGMTAHGGSRKRGLNREILSTAPATFLSLLRFKAEEAGVVWVEIPTQKVKPSQTCSRCGRQRKKPLSERTHSCECGLTLGRDENAARVMLNWALTRSPAGQELSGCGVGSLDPASKHETPTIPA